MHDCMRRETVSTCSYRWLTRVVLNVEECRKHTFFRGFLGFIHTCFGLMHTHLLKSCTFVGLKKTGTFTIIRSMVKHSKRNILYVSIYNANEHFTMY